jgi:hypothetical protein
MKRALLMAAMAGNLIASALPAQASPEPTKRTPRRLVYGLIGAAVGAGAAAFYVSAQDDGVTPGLCSQTSCVATFSVGLGTLVGYMVGREFDQLHALRYKGRTPLRPVESSAPLTGEPMLLVARDSLVVAGGPGGLQVFNSREGLMPTATRASGIRGISALDIAGSAAALAVGSTSGTYIYPPRNGPGVLIREGEATALAAGGELLYLGAGQRILVAPVSADTTGNWPGIDAGGRVETLAWDGRRGLLWAIVDTLLVAYRPAGDSLERVGGVGVGGTGRRIAIEGTRVAVASGENGVRLIDASDPARPSARWHWPDARFVYDVSMFAQRLYVAAGVEGVYVLDVSGAAPVVLGLARDLGFATALAASGGNTFVLDRGTNALRRFRSDF